MTDLEIPLGKRRPLYRFLEMLPAILSYGMLLVPIVLSIINPLWAAAFIIVYTIAWLVKAIGMTFRTVQGYQLLQRASAIDWAERLADLQKPAAALARQPADDGWRATFHHQHLEALAAAAHARRPSQMYNAVIIPTHNEGRDVLEPTIKTILASDYDPAHIIFLLAYEERGGPEVAANARQLVADYGGRFRIARAVMHPDSLPDEVKGKGGNITHAGRVLQGILAEEGIDPHDVIVTTLDSDNRPHRSYLSYLTYEYIVHPQPERVAFQPLVLFLNNIWDAPAPMRVIATGNSFWNIINSLRPHMLRNFSSHSQSMSALIDMDFWSTRTIVEDGHHFWRSYFRYDGHYDVVPIYLPIYQDAVLGETYKKTLRAQFGQLRRWAYGASDVPYVGVRVFSRHRTVPLVDGLSKFFRLLESHVSWASSSVILLLGAWAPLFINPLASRSIVAHELPSIASTLQRGAMVGLFVTVFLAFKLLPPRPERYKRRRTVGMLAQWLIMPFTSILYGSLAAYNAQTHLLFGRYLDVFDATVKAVGAQGEAADSAPPDRVGTKSS